MLKNKTLGSALMIAGTTIGAGMLAMPLTSAGMGFGFTAFLLVLIWLVLTFSGLLFAEVYQTAKQKDDGVASLAEQYFGMGGRAISTISLLVLLYALSAAYITGGGSLLSGLLPDFEYKLETAIILFTAILGAFVVLGTSSVDGITRVLFMGKIAAFAFVLFMLLPKASVDNLMALPLDYAFVLSAAPVFVTSFGYHIIMGSVNNYLDGDTKRFRTAIILGTSIPLTAYLLWQLATHGVLSQSEFVVLLQDDPTLNGLVNATRQITGSNLMGEVVRIFSSLALITSFLGVMLGVFEGLRDLFKRFGMANNRLVISIAAFTPPLAFALFYPQGFIFALGFAGIICAFYLIMLPIGLAYRTRKAHPNLPYRVAGGNLSLILGMIFAFAVIIIPFLSEAGILPKVAG
ncbi:tyrosine transporter [Pasteurellaceae bacterium RH1A]|nr:tyrosine transporter [Pasteurellaceae bacterium RH1A]